MFATSPKTLIQTQDECPTERAQHFRIHSWQPPQDLTRADYTVSRRDLKTPGGACLSDVSAFAAFICQAVSAARVRFMPLQYSMRSAASQCLNIDSSARQAGRRVVTVYIDGHFTRRRRRLAAVCIFVKPRARLTRQESDQQCTEGPRWLRANNTRQTSL